VERSIKVSIDGSIVLEEDMAELRDIWESTRFELEKLQRAHKCVDEEKFTLRNKETPM